MKFRAKLVDIACIQQFSKLVTTVGKFSKTCTLQLCEAQVVFTDNERAANGGTSFWCEINQGDYFDEYRIEGKDETKRIFLEIVNENIARAMRSGQHAQSIKIKLTRKQTPCLTFEITLPSLTAHTRNVVHDVPVAVIPVRYWDDFRKPLLLNYDVKVSLPPLKTLKSIVERMRNVSGYLVVSATNEGDMRFKVETEEVRAVTHFRGMLVENDEQPAENCDDNNNEVVEARVDINKLATFLHAQQLNPTKTVCGIADGQAVHLFMQCHDSMFQYFVPAVNLSIS